MAFLSQFSLLFKGVHDLCRFLLPFPSMRWNLLYSYWWILQGIQNTFSTRVWMLLIEWFVFLVTLDIALQCSAGLRYLG